MVFVEEFAKKWHADQRYGEYPYSKHLQAVHDVAARFNLPKSVKTAAWLHDTVEDTDCTLREIEENFGAEVAHLVDAVTDRTGKNREESHRNTYPRLREFGRDAVSLKLADRIANVESGGKLDEYRREYPYFKEALFVEGEQDKMWLHLDELLTKAGD